MKTRKAYKNEIFFEWKLEKITENVKKNTFNLSWLFQKRRFPNISAYYRFLKVRTPSIT